MSARTLAYAALIGACLAGMPLVTTAAVDRSVQSPAPEAVEEARQKLRAAIQSLSNNDMTNGRKQLEELMRLPEFDGLSAEEQHHAFSMSGYAALSQGDYVAAKRDFTRASKSGYATGIDWYGRLMSASMLQDIPEQVISLTTIAKRWPQTLADIKAEAVYQIVYRAKSELASRDAYIDLIEALFDAKWVDSAKQQPSNLWLDLALSALQEKKIDRAAEIAAKIDDPYALVVIRVDNRFVPILKKGGVNTDVVAAAERDVVVARQAVLDSPRQLRPVVLLSYALQTMRRYPEMLDSLDKALNAALDPTPGAPGFEDAAKHLIWVMNNRALALAGLGRWDEAEQQLIKAMRRPENGDMNVSQAINLGDFYCERGQPEKAKDAIAELGSMSPYGRMQVEKVRLCVAAQTGDRVAAEKSLAYIREHRKDAPPTYERALLTAGLDDEAAAALIARLADREQRAAALRAVQGYEEPPLAEKAAELQQRWYRLLERKDVRTAIEKVGKIERFKLAQPLS